MSQTPVVKLFVPEYAHRFNQSIQKVQQDLEWEFSKSTEEKENPIPVEYDG